MNEMIQRRKNLKNRKGFTLIELIVVIAILGILAAILIPQFTGFQAKANSTQVMVEAKQIATAADGLFIEKGSAPTESEIITVAGSDVDGTLIVDSVTDGHVLFTYTKTIDGYHYKAERKVVGSEVTLEVTYNATP